MKTTTLLIALLLTGSADDLASVTAGPVKLSMPAAWKKENVNGTFTITAPSEDAFFTLDTGAVQTTGMTPEVCLQKIQKGIGGEWLELKVGGFPAASKTDIDTDPEKKDFVTRTFVGCNGKTTWSIEFHLIAAKQARFGPVAEKIVASLQYIQAK